jgi:hypothetical protein
MKRLHSFVWAHLVIADGRTVAANLPVRSLISTYHEESVGGKEVVLSNASTGLPKTKRGMIQPPFRVITWSALA